MSSSEYDHIGYSVLYYSEEGERRQQKERRKNRRETHKIKTCHMKIKTAHALLLTTVPAWMMTGWLL